MLIAGAAVGVYALPNPNTNFKEIEPLTNLVDSFDLGIGSEELENGVKELQVQLSDDSVKTYMVAGMIISVPSTMSDDLRQDVLYSLLLTLFGSDFKFSRNTQLQQWVDMSSTTLTNIFWSGKSGPISDLVVDGDQFTIADVALKRMGANPDMTKAVPTFTKIFDTLKQRPDSDSAIKILIYRTYDDSTHDTTQIFCYVTSDQVEFPSASILLINLSGAKDKTGRPLAHPYKTNEVKAKKEMFVKLLLDDQTYASQLRNQVKQKLGDCVKNDIVQIY